MINNNNIGEINKYSNLSLAQIVIDNFKAAAVFEKYSLDFSFNGNKTILQACKEKGIETNQVLNDLENIKQDNIEIPVKVDDWELDFIVDYIMNNHHVYVKNMIPVISNHTKKAASLHGNEHPELNEVAQIFSVVYKDLKHHMMKEEEILFPYIKYLVKVKKGNAKFEKPYFGRIDNPINFMELEHQDAGENMYKIRKLTNNYIPFTGSGDTYKIVLKELKEFEEDHHKHVHLENHLLFPKAILLEEQILENL